MKYIIEIKPEYEDTTKGIIVLGARDSDLYAIENLEELNSDYINEHFGDLQDTAYQRGLEDGKEYGLDESDMREAVSYQRGLEDGKAVNDKGCEGCRYGGTTQGDSPCFNCSNYYQNNWTAKQTDDEIKVGDELEHTVSGYTSKAIFLEKIVDDEDWYKCLFWTGCGVAILSYPKSQFKRTGKHYGIDKILESMKHD